MSTVKQVGETTIGPVESGNTDGHLPEFGRVRDCQRLYGLKRGTLYNLLADGKIKGVLLRVRGQKSGVRLIALRSVRQYIESEMAAAQTTGTPN